MKKSYLLLLAILPIFGSCNKNSGFANPFPNDTYNKIGFTIDANNEKITRPLTTAETNLVLDTIAQKGKSGEPDSKIYSMTATRETREYTKAFAGEFKQGYSVKNVMKHEDIKAYRQDENTTAETTLNPTDRSRTLINNSSTTKSQYSYGEIDEKVNQDNYIYFKETGGAKWTELSKKLADTEKVSLYNRTKKVENGTYKSYYDEELIKDTVKSELGSYFYITQSQYITTPDSKSGADSNGNIILVNATQTKHKDSEEGSEEGVYKLKDGRKYQAMDNSLIVTKLTVQDKSWCLASYVRIYKETVITSEVIQPNVQVKKLSSPITISYSEEIAKYSTVKSPIGDELPKEGD